MRGSHGLSCEKGSGRSTRHHQANDLIWRSLRSADIPTTKEPTGLMRADGLTLVPWQNGHCLTWGATAVDTFTSFYVAFTSSTPGATAEAAATRKLSKYSTISQTLIFILVAWETTGPINAEGLCFLCKLGEWLVSVLLTPENRHSYSNDFLYLCNGLIWLLSVALSIQRRTSEISHSTLVFNLRF